MHPRPASHTLADNVETDHPRVEATRSQVVVALLSFQVTQLAFMASF